ncbi:MAG: hypothetical protein ACWA6X_15060 [Bauldia sp.]|jgi:hypothetical protein
MTLSENATSGVARGLRGFGRRRKLRRLQAALAGKPDRLLRDMGLDPDTVHAGRWDYELGAPQAIGNRP